MTERWVAAGPGARRFVGLLAIAVLLVGGCGRGASGSETPAEAVEAIIALYEREDFATLVRTRYAELWKAEDEEEVQRVVDWFRTRYGEEEARDRAIAVYRSVLELSPEVSDDGDVAVYRLDEGVVKLSRMPSGKWGFHL